MTETIQTTSPKHECYVRDLLAQRLARASSQGDAKLRTGNELISASRANGFASAYQREDGNRAIAEGKALLDQVPHYLDTLVVLDSSMDTCPYATEPRPHTSTWKRLLGRGAAQACVNPLAYDIVAAQNPELAAELESQGRLRHLDEAQ